MLMKKEKTDVFLGANETKKRGSSECLSKWKVYLFSCPKWLLHPQIYSTNIRL